MGWSGKGWFSGGGEERAGRDGMERWWELTGVVDEVVDSSVEVECFFSFLLELFRRGGDVEGHGVCAFGFEVVELGGVASCGDDFVAAAEGFSGKGGTEAAAAAGDEPDFGGHVDFVWATVDVQGGLLGRLGLGMECKLIGKVRLKT